MTKRIPVTLIAAFICLSQIGGRAAPERFGRPVSDGRGGVWAAIAAGRWPSTAVGRWTGTEWQALPAPSDTDGYLGGLVTTPSGQVLTYWGGHHPILALYDGSTPRTVGAIDVPDPFTQIAADAGNYYQIGQSGKLVQFTPPSTGGKVLLDKGCPTTWCVDGAGRIYFYGQGLWTVVDGAAVDLVQKGNLPSDTIASVAVLGDHQLLLGYHGSGLIAFDTQSFTSHSLITAGDHERSQILAVRRRAHDCVVVIAGKNLGADHPAAHEVHVWTLSADRLSPLYDFIDSDLNQPQYPLASTSAGDFLGTAAHGYCFFPAHGGKPRMIDWHEGFPMKGVEAFAVSRDGNVMSYHPNYAGGLAFTSTLHSERFATAPALRQPRMEPAISHYVVDRSGVIWRISKIRGNPPKPCHLEALKDGKWVAVYTPAEVEVTWYSNLSLDNRGCLWLDTAPRPSDNHALVTVRTPVGWWRSYPDIETAYRAEAKLSVQEKQAPISFDTDYHISFSVDGRVAYMPGWSKVRYFDGYQWDDCPLPTTDGHPRNDIATAIPFFDKDGHLAMSPPPRPGPAQTTLVFGPTQWSSQPYEPPTHVRTFDREKSAQMTGDRQRLGFPADADEEVDADGVAWIVAEQVLYRVVDDKAVRVFDDKTANPFLDGRLMREVLVDSKGYRFIHTTGDGEEYIFIDAQQTGH